MIFPFHLYPVCLSRPFEISSYFFPGLFFFSSFHYSWHGMFNIIFCRWLDSNCGPLDLESTTLPTEPQPLPFILLLVRLFVSNFEFSFEAKFFSLHHAFVYIFDFFLLLYILTSSSFDFLMDHIFAPQTLKALHRLKSILLQAWFLKP